MDLMKPGHFLSMPWHTGLILNTDGVHMFKSSKSTRWPIYLAITNLPPTIRMNLDYLLLAGVYCGPNKPSMEIILPPVLAAIRRIESDGITVDTTEGRKVVRAKLLMGVFDLPAKASATNMK